MRKANINELENNRSTVRTWKPTTQERFSTAHANYLKEALASELLPVLHVQRGNRKTGAIPCINMPMLITCPSEAACRAYCYVGKECRYKKQLTFRYNSENLALFLRDKTSFLSAVKAAINNDSIIRWHESGDIVNADYFRVIVEVANFYPQKKFYGYTKKYNIVNDYIAKNGALPSNLTVIFSADKNLKMINPHNLPVAKIDFGDGEKINGFKCPGKCMECAMHGVGCMNFKNGETVVFAAH